MTTFTRTPIHGIVRGKGPCSGCGVRAWRWHRHQADAVLVCVGCDHSTDGRHIVARRQTDADLEPCDKDKAAAVRLFENAKARASDQDEVAIALVCLATMIAEARRLDHELEDRVVAMEVELAEALGLDPADTSISFDDMVKQIREASASGNEREGKVGETGSTSVAELDRGSMTATEGALWLREHDRAFEWHGEANRPSPSEHADAAVLAERARPRRAARPFTARVRLLGDRDFPEGDWLSRALGDGLTVVLDLDERESLRINVDALGNVAVEPQTGDVGRRLRAEIERTEEEVADLRARPYEGPHSAKAHRHHREELERRIDVLRRIEGATP